MNNYSEGQEVILRAIPEEGYEFVEWTADISGSNPNRSLIVNKNYTISASFESTEPIWSLVLQHNFNASRILFNEYYINTTDYGYYDNINMNNSIVNGYRHKNSNPGYLRASEYLGENFHFENNYRIELDLITYDLVDDESIIGFIYNMIDFDNYNMFVLRSNGNFAIWNQVNGSWSDNLIDTQGSNVIYQSYTVSALNWNKRIIFENVDNEYTISVVDLVTNGQQEIFKGSLNYENGIYGQGFALVASNVEFIYDNIIFYTEENTLINNKNNNKNSNNEKLHTYNININH